MHKNRKNKIILILFIFIYSFFWSLIICVFYEEYIKPNTSESSLVDASKASTPFTEDISNSEDTNLEKESSDLCIEESDSDSYELNTYGTDNIITFQSRASLMEVENNGKDYVGYEYRNMDICYRVTTAVFDKGTEESIYKRFKSLVLK